MQCENSRYFPDLQIHPHHIVSYASSLGIQQLIQVSNIQICHQPVSYNLHHHILIDYFRFLVYEEYCWSTISSTKMVLPIKWGKSRKMVFCIISGQNTVLHQCIYLLDRTICPYPILAIHRPYQSSHAINLLDFLSMLLHSSTLSKLRLFPWMQRRSSEASKWVD